MQSPDNTLVAAGGSITDALGNVWTITAGGQVAVNGVADPTTANVTHLAYTNGLVWQENTADLWWSKSTPTDAWNPPYGTDTVPVPVPNQALYNLVIGVSANTTPTGTFTDSSANTWSIVNGQVSVNGALDLTTADVIEIAYINGSVWQENTQGLWWSKTAPADAWSPPYGTTTNPVVGTFYIFDNPGNYAIVNVGELTASVEGGSGIPPISTAQIITPGISATGTAIGVSTETAKLVVTGDSSLTQGATLTLIGAYRTPVPVYGPIQNDGVMTVDASKITVAALTGTGTIDASHGSSLAIQSAAATDTIHLQASHLTIGGPAFGSGGLTFLAPITMDKTSTITLAQTPATTEVVKHAGRSISEVLLYNGTTEVADLHVKGVSHLYATESGSGPTAMTILTTDCSSLDLPIVRHVG